MLVFNKYFYKNKKSKLYCHCHRQLHLPNRREHGGHAYMQLCCYSDTLVAILVVHTTHTVLLQLRVTLDG
jgi:hypothetical protein